MYDDKEIMIETLEQSNKENLEEILELKIKLNNISNIINKYSYVQHGWNAKCMISELEKELSE